VNNSFLLFFVFLSSVLGAKYECFIYENWPFTCNCKVFKDHTLGLDALT